MTSDLDTTIKNLEQLMNMAAPAAVPVAYISERIAALKVERSRQKFGESVPRTMEKVGALFGGPDPRLRQVERELELLSRAYVESANYNECSFCDALLEIGEPHEHDCEFAAVEARAKMRAEKSARKSGDQAENQREKGYVCGLAYLALPDSEKASMEWQAHAERILCHLYDAGLLHKAPDLIRKAD